MGDVMETPTKPNRGGRPSLPSSVEGMVIREVAEQVKQNNALRTLTAQIISNLKRLIKGKEDDLGAQVQAAAAVVELMTASTKAIETLAKNIVGLQKMQAESGSDLPDDIRALLAKAPTSKGTEYGKAAK